MKCILSASAVLLFLGSAVAADPVVKSEAVVEGIFALVGPIGPRLPENLELNTNYGLIDTAQEAILI